ncbi:MAG: hypothetical protein AAEC10_06540, partial [Rhodospirillales bacterium]
NILGGIKVSTRSKYRRTKSQRLIVAWGALSTVTKAVERSHRIPSRWGHVTNSFRPRKCVVCYLKTLFSYDKVNIGRLAQASKEVLGSFCKHPSEFELSLRQQSAKDLDKQRESPIVGLSSFVMGAPF